METIRELIGIAEDLGLDVQSHKVYMRGYSPVEGWFMKAYSMAVMERPKIITEIYSIT